MSATQELNYFNQEGLEHIPQKLLQLPQAITWQAGNVDPKTGKFDKLPKGKDGTGRGWPKAEQWLGDLSVAIKLAQEKKLSGVGIVLPAVVDGMHVVAFDWDGVDFNSIERMEEIMQDWEAIGKPYMEISPSGKGLRAFVLSRTPVKDVSRTCPSGGKDELFCYNKGRWMTVTGNKFKPGGLPDATDAVEVISDRWALRKIDLLESPDVLEKKNSSVFMTLAHLTGGCGFEWPKESLKDGDGRELTMLRYAGHLRSQEDFPQSEIERMCLEANVEHYAHPLEESVVLDRARRYADKQLELRNAVKQDWADLIPLPPKYRPAPPLSPEMLPLALSEYVTDCANRMRIPVEMIATPMLVAFGSVLGKKVCVQPRSKDTNWLEFPNLWGASILPPAMLKSPSLNAAMKFINELETNAQREHAFTMREWDSEERVRKLEIKLKEVEAKKSLKSGDRAGARRHLDLLQEIKPPIRKRYVISDATPEARLEILCDNPNGVLLLRDELDGHIAQLRKDGFENARAQELQFFDGHQDYTDDRIKRGSHIAEGPRMALYGNLQPAKVEKYLREMHKGGSDDGYLQRLLQLAIQPTIEQEFELLELKPNQKAETLARDIFQAAQGLPLLRDPLTRRITPRVLKFDPEAQVEFDQFLVALENKLRSGGISNPVIAAHFGKYRGTLPKLALILALAENPKATCIPFSAFDQAKNLLIFYQKHAKRIYGVVQHYELASAYELLERIKKGQLHDGFNPRDDIQRKEWEGLRTSGEIEAALELLVTHNCVRVIEEKTTGRSKRVVLIHPQLLRQKGTKV